MVELLKSNNIIISKTDKATKVIEKPERLTPQVPPPPSLQKTSEKIFSDSIDTISTQIPKPHKESFKFPDRMKTSEYWLNKIGIGLIILSVIFLFKYSIDKGWITPQIRILFGLLLGLILSGFGLRLYNKRRHFSLVLFGGGIATFYITGFAAYQLLEVVPFTTVFAFMVLVTLFSFIISVKQNELILSLLSIVGGLLTPFLLYTGSSNIPGLISYTCLLLLGAVTIYFFKGWRSLLSISVLGGWIIFVIALLEGTTALFVTAPLKNQWAIQGSFFFAALFFWGVPIMREIFSVKLSSRFKDLSMEYVKKHFSKNIQSLVGNQVLMLSISTPIIGFYLSCFVWDKSDIFWGITCVVISLLLWSVSWMLNKIEHLKNLAYTHLLVGILFITQAILFFFDNNMLFIVLTTEVAVLHLVARKFSRTGIAICSYILLWITGSIFLSRLTNDTFVNQVFLSTNTLSDFWFIVVLFGLSYLSIALLQRRIYILAAFAGLAGIFFREINDNNLLFFILTLEGVSFQYLVYRSKDKIIQTGCHVFFIGLFAYLFYRLHIYEIPALATMVTGIPFGNYQALTDIFFILTGLGVTFSLSNSDEKNIYRFVLHVAFLIFLLRELVPLENGQGYTSIAWGMYAVILFLFALRRNIKQLRLVALGTLFVVVGKLLLIDLSELDYIWRILLFLGFGGVFLLLSYYFKSIWKSDNPGNS